MTTTYYKAVRPDGTSFHDPSFRWVPESGPIPDDGLLVSHPRHLDRRSAAGYLSVSTVPTDCTGLQWPCQLLALTPVRGRKVVTPEPHSLPNKRGASAWLVVDRLDPHLALGPQGPEVAAIIDRAGRLTQEEAALLDAARDAATATVVRDLISPADYQTLAGPWLSVTGETR